MVFKYYIVSTVQIVCDASRRRRGPMPTTPRRDIIILLLLYRHAVGNWSNRLVCGPVVVVGASGGHGRRHIPVREGRWRENGETPLPQWNVKKKRNTYRRCRRKRADGEGEERERESIVELIFWRRRFATHTHKHTHIQYERRSCGGLARMRREKACDLRYCCGVGPRTTDRPRTRARVRPTKIRWNRLPTL